MPRSVTIVYRIGICCALMTFALLVTSSGVRAQTQKCCATNSPVITINCSAPGCTGQITTHGCGVTCEGYWYYLSYAGCCAHLYQIYITSERDCLNPLCVAPENDAQKSPPPNAPLPYLKDCSGHYVVANPEKETTVSVAL